MKSPKVKTEIVSNVDASKANSRRQFITKAAAGGVVATLASKTAWAGNIGGATGCSVSGNLSGNLSNACGPDSSLASVSGRSPGYWHTVLNKKSHPHKDQTGTLDKKWSDVFGVGREPFNNIGNSSDKISTFLPNGSHSTTAHKEINMHLVAAYLNAETGLYPLANGVLSTDYAEGLYDMISSGSYTQGEMASAIEATYDDSL